MWHPVQLVALLSAVAATGANSDYCNCLPARFTAIGFELTNKENDFKANRAERVVTVDNFTRLISITLKWKELQMPFMELIEKSRVVIDDYRDPSVAYQYVIDDNLECRREKKNTPWPGLCQWKYSLPVMLGRIDDVSTIWTDNQSKPSVLVTVGKECLPLSKTELRNSEFDPNRNDLNSRHYYQFKLNQEVDKIRIPDICPENPVASNDRKVGARMSQFRPDLRMKLPREEDLGMNPMDVLGSFKDDDLDSKRFPVVPAGVGGKYPRVAYSYSHQRRGRLHMHRGPTFLKASGLRRRRIWNKKYRRKSYHKRSLLDIF